MKIKDKEVKGIIFDIDGTLIDSCGIWTEVDKAFFKKRNLIMPGDYAQSIAHIGLEKAAEYTIRRFSLQEKKEDIIKEWKSGVVDLYAHHVLLKPHVREYLEYLHSNNIPICAATANDKDCYKSALVNNGIFDYFKFILEVGNFPCGKEKPDIYKYAAKKLNVPINECAVFEDIFQGLSTAKDAGFITIGVFEKTSKEEKEKQAIADIYIKDFQELL